MELSERYSLALQRAPGGPLNPNQVEKATGFSRAASSLILNGQTKTMKYENAKKLERLLRVRAEWLMDGKGSMSLDDVSLASGSNIEPTALPPSDMVYVDKVKGARLAAGDGQIVYDFENIDKSHAFRLDWMQKKGLRAERCKVWTVRGDSMEPRYPNGSWVLINMAEREPVHGKNFALIGDDGLRLKQLRRSESGGWIMHSLNPDQSNYPPEPIVGDNYAVIGRVRGHGGDDD